MKLKLEGKINVYYVQMLCMTYFPGAKFGVEEQEEEGAPELDLKLVEEADGIRGFATVTDKGNSATAERFHAYDPLFTKEKTAKVVSGSAIMAACGELFGYRPSWGMLIGVRPSKVATELLALGWSKTKTKKFLTGEYGVIPKKAALAVDVSINEQKIVGVPKPNDCSVYISIPFCPTRCAYCSFISYASKQMFGLIPEYLLHLASDMDETFAKIKSLGLRVKTVYVGGGTPTILSEDQLRFLLTKINELTDVGALEEFTLESGRPDTITAEKMKIAKEYGVTRVCVNPQTLCNEVLQQIGRSHTAEDFERAYVIARESGIPIINCDLITGLPGDTFKTFSKSFDRIMALRPENVTVHTFCVKRASDILKEEGKNIYSMRGGDTGKCVDYSQLKAQELGYLPYYMYRQKNAVGNFENVGFALAGTEGRYNVYMMEEIHSVFALGAGAVSKMVNYQPESGKGPLIERLFYPKYPFEYLRDQSTKAKNDAEEDFYRRQGWL